jgi:hypothetical protein
MATISYGLLDYPRWRGVLQTILEVLLLVLVAEKVEQAEGVEKTRSCWRVVVLRAIPKVLLLLVLAEKVEPAGGVEKTRKGVAGLPKL